MSEAFLFSTILLCKNFVHIIYSTLNDCVGVVDVNNILNLILTNQADEITSVITIVNNMNRLITVYQEWYKGVTIRFFDNDTGRTIGNGEHCQGY